MFGEQYGKGIEATGSGKNIGVDFALKKGTDVPVPQGTWKVIRADSGYGDGNITDFKRTPYGNSVFVQNIETGEKIRLSHLSQVDVQKGDILDGGTIIGKSGASGNTTGAHLDAEYYTNKGVLSDILKTPYGQYYLGKPTDDVDNLKSLVQQAKGDYGTASNYIKSLFSKNKSAGTMSTNSDIDAITELSKLLQ